MMENVVTVSVIIPFYSDVEWLCEAVDSVIKQTYPVFEIIVVNDGSREIITDFLEKYGDKVDYIFKENGGPATARNLGIEKSRGDYIAFLDSDDIWLPSKIEKQLKQMIENNVVWSHSAYETFDTTTGNTIKKISIDNFNGMIFPKMLYSNPLATPGIIIKRDILFNNPSWRFNNKMRYGQDQYLWMCIAPIYPIYAVNEVLVRVRLRGSNAALRARVQLRAKAIIYKNVLKGSPEKNKKVSMSGRIAFHLCVVGEKVLTFFEKRFKKERFLEGISRVLYIIPWILFKINHRLSNNI